MIKEFLTQSGAEVHKSCPRCGSEKWNDSATSDERVVVEVARNGYLTGTYYIDCGNCGFVENYLWKPLIEFYSAK